MKFLVLVFFSFSFSAFSQSIILNLNKFGKPLYQRDLRADRGLIVYTGKNRSFAKILPREYYNLGNSNDTLNLEISRQSDLDSIERYSVSCSNCKEIEFTYIENSDSNFFVFSKGNDFVKFIISFEKEPKGMHSAPPLKEVVRDSLIGFIRLKNTFIHYSPIIPNSNVNIGFIDKNFNGRIDSMDFVALSNDDYFFTTSNEKSRIVNDVKTIKVNGDIYRFKIIDNLNYSISLEQIGSSLQADLVYNDSLTNIKLGERNLYDILENQEYVLISYWSEFCSPCISGIPKLNGLPDNVEVIGLYYGQTTITEVEKHYSIGYYNTDKLGNAVSLFNLNGFPNYILIDKTRKVILKTRDLDEIIKIVG